MLKKTLIRALWGRNVIIGDSRSLAGIQSAFYFMEIFMRDAKSFQFVLVSVEG